MATKTAGTAPASTPEQLQSVRGALLSPRRLKIEVLGGLVVALALIPEAIAFSIIAGVDPRIGLFASFTMAVTISLPRIRLPRVNLKFRRPWMSGSTVPSMRCGPAWTGPGGSSPPVDASAARSPSATWSSFRGGGCGSAGPWTATFRWT